MPAPARHLLLSLATAVLAAAPSRALAELGDDGFEIHDRSAWPLRAGELAVGPRDIALGLADLFTLRSTFALNAIGAPNASLKWLIHDAETFGIGVEVGFLYFDPDLIGLDETFSLTAVPMSLNVSARPRGDLRLHAALDFLAAQPDEAAPDLALRLQRHLGAVGKLAARLSGEVRFGRHVALLLDLEAPLILHEAPLRYPDEDSAADFLRATFSVHFVVDSFNLRLGGGYGPSWLGRTGFFPTAELYFRIY